MKARHSFDECLADIDADDFACALAGEVDCLCTAAACEVENALAGNVADEAQLSGELYQYVKGIGLVRAIS